jgi:hypothetical protein
MAALGAGWAGGLAGGSSPCGKQFASGTLCVKYNFLLLPSLSPSVEPFCQYDQHPWLKLRKTEVFSMIQGTVECLGYKKSEVHCNAPKIPPCPASKRTGQAQYLTF